jgi:hypothetical protein
MPPQTYSGCQPDAFPRTAVSRDLNEDFVPFLNCLAYAFELFLASASRNPNATRNDVSHIQEPVPFQTDIHEGGVNSGDDGLDNSFIDIFNDSRFAFDFKVNDPSVFQHGYSSFHGVALDQDQNLAVVCHPQPSFEPLNFSVNRCQDYAIAGVERACRFETGCVKLWQRNLTPILDI